MKKSLMLTMFLGVIPISAAFAAPGDTLWTRTYGGSNWDGAYSVQQTNDGGYIIAGETASFGAGDWDFYLVKTDGTGDTLWTRTYGGSNADVALSVRQTVDGGYIIAGYTESLGAGGKDFFLVKTDAVGDTLWTRTYGGSDWDVAYSVQQTIDGGYIMAGGTWSFGNGYDDFYLVKTSSSGDTLWTRTYGDSSYDEAHAVQQTTDGGYVVAGLTKSFGAGSVDFYLLKTDSSGDTMWTRVYGGSDWDGANCTQQTADGGYIVAGHTFSFGAGDQDCYVMKTDPSGDTLWTKTYGGIFDDGAASVQQTTDGGYIVAGWTWSFGAGEEDFYLVKTDAVGDTLWTRTYGGSDWDVAYSVQQTIDGGYIMAGNTHSFGAGEADFYLVKVEGVISGIPGNNSEEDTPVKFTLNSNYPNPFNPATNIDFALPEQCGVDLSIFNLTGQKVATLVDAKMESGNYTITWDGSNFSSGIYFYKLTAGDFTKTKRMTLLK